MLEGTRNQQVIGRQGHFTIWGANVVNCEWAAVHDRFVFNHEGMEGLIVELGSIAVQQGCENNNNNDNNVI